MSKEQAISSRERVRYDSDGLTDRDGTEYRCRGCGKWSHIDDWTCCGFSEEDDDCGPEFDKVYCGDDAIVCPKCGLSQPTPGVIALQTEIDFDQ